MNFNELCDIATRKLQSLNLDQIYTDRLAFEIAEIIKQGAEGVWIDRHVGGKKFKSNPNSLLIPWLLGMVDVDPMLNRATPILNNSHAAVVAKYRDEHGQIPHDLLRDLDNPDIDIDCIDIAREELKSFAIEKYGGGKVGYDGSICSVGSWRTFLFKLAICDAAGALGLDKRPIEELVSKIPDDVNSIRPNGVGTCAGKIEVNGVEKDCKTVHVELLCPKCGSPNTDSPTIARVMSENEPLQLIESEWPGLITAALGLIGRVCHISMHAGAIIIADRPLFGNVPLARSSNSGQWVSMWTEGANAQLSKLGYVKWDILGLETLKWIYKACELIKANRNVSFGENLSGWDELDPVNRRAGYLIADDGTKHYIELDDRAVLAIANDKKTETIFQLDTPLARDIMSYGANSFDDIMFLTAMGHPGPMACVAAGQLVDTVDGLQRIEDCSSPIKAMTIDGSVIYTDQYKVVKTGSKKVVRVTLSDGRTLVVSKDHKIAVDGLGYVPAAKLVTGQKVVSAA